MIVLNQVDFGRGLVRDPMGSTLAELRKGGEVRSHEGLLCGLLDGFTMPMLRELCRAHPLVTHLIGTLFH